MVDDNKLVIPPQPGAVFKSIFDGLSVNVMNNNNIILVTNFESKYTVDGWEVPPDSGPTPNHTSASKPTPSNHYLHRTLVLHSKSAQLLLNKTLILKVVQQFYAN